MNRNNRNEALTKTRNRTIRYVAGIRIVIDLPAVEPHEDRRFFRPNCMSQLRRFIRQSIPKTDAALEEGRFTLSTDVTYWERQGVKRVILSRWKAGQSIGSA